MGSLTAPLWRFLFIQQLYIPLKGFRQPPAAEALGRTSPAGYNTMSEQLPTLEVSVEKAAKVKDALKTTIGSCKGISPAVGG